MASTILSLLLLSFSLISATKLRTHRTTNRTTITNDTYTYFQVTKPIQLPNTKPCSTLTLQHDFAYTYGSPPITTQYSPPFNCPATKFSKTVLQWSATSKGRQFDRIFGVWLGGVDLLRSCTAEPRATGIQWNVNKDITRYYSLLMTNHTLSVYLGNIIDDTYTGVYHVNITFHFYPFQNNNNNKLNTMELEWADLIIPVSRTLPLNDGLWFQIQNSTDVKVKPFTIPQNAYPAVLEVYLSFHENDEFWPTNVPNEYISDNNLTGFPGNGPFREVVVSLDGRVIGAVWPFTVVYTGGVNPLLWRPITGIGSFDLPSYDIEVTPYLGTVLNGKSHEFGFSVTNALNVWYIDANLHVWVDETREKTTGKFMTQSISPLHVSLVSNYTGLNGKFVTKVTRSIKSTGWVESSHGKIVTESTQEFNYTNIMVMQKDADLQIVNQIIEFNDTVYGKNPSVVSKQSLKSFLFDIYSDTKDKGNGSYAEVANITLGFNEKRVDDSGGKRITSVLENIQNGQGVMFVKGNLVVSGLGSTQQMYNYGDDDGYCYSRDVSSSNYTVIYDNEGYSCSKSEKSRFSGPDRHAI